MIFRIAFTARSRTILPSVSPPPATVATSIVRTGTPSAAARVATLPLTRAIHTSFMPVPILAISPGSIAAPIKHKTFSSGRSIPMATTLPSKNIVTPGPCPSYFLRTIRILSIILPSISSARKMAAILGKRWAGISLATTNRSSRIPAAPSPKIRPALSSTI